MFSARKQSRRSEARTGHKKKLTDYLLTNNRNIGVAGGVE